MVCNINKQISDCELSSVTCAEDAHNLCFNIAQSIAQQVYEIITTERACEDMTIHIELRNMNKLIEKYGK